MGTRAAAGSGAACGRGWSGTRVTNVSVAAINRLPKEVPSQLPPGTTRGSGRWSSSHVVTRLRRAGVPLYGQRQAARVAAQGRPAGTGDSAWTPHPPSRRGPEESEHDHPSTRTLPGTPD